MIYIYITLRGWFDLPYSWTRMSTRNEGIQVFQLRILTEYFIEMFVMGKIQSCGVYVIKISDRFGLLFSSTIKIKPVEQTSHILQRPFFIKKIFILKNV